MNELEVELAHQTNPVAKARILANKKLWISMARVNRRHAAHLCKSFGFRFREPDGMDLTHPLPLTGKKLKGGGKVLKFRSEKRKEANG